MDSVGAGLLLIIRYRIYELLFWHEIVFVGV